MRFKLLNGEFEDKLTGKVIKAGGVVESKRNLVTTYPNKFQLVEMPPVERPAENKVTPPVVPAIPAAVSSPSIPSPERKSTELGTEVTDRFPAATKQGLRVFRKGNQYNVTDAEEIKTPLNTEPLLKISMVEFLTSFSGK